MRWPFVRRGKYEAMRDVAQQHEREAQRQACKAADEAGNTECLYGVMKSLNRLTGELQAHNLPRLHTIEAEPEFQRAVASHIRAMDVFVSDHGRMPQGYESLTLLGVCIARGPVGSITLIPEEG